MSTIKFHAATGKLILKSGKATCSCCTELVINYDWAGTGMADLDTATTAFGETLGFACGGSGVYVLWISGDQTGINASERVDVRVDAARTAGLWTSSYNVTCKAGWFTSALGSGNATLRATYNGVTKTKTISPGNQSGCASTVVATVTVYAAAQPDGSFFEIL